MRDYEAEGVFVWSVIATAAAIWLTTSAAACVDFTRDDVMGLRQREVNEVVRGFRYIKDPQTGACFVYAWVNGVGNGGPALATVPCDVVPPTMLEEAKP